MKLSEMEVLPQKAGVAILKFVDEADKNEWTGRSLPVRDGVTIVFPKDPNLEFIPLVEGRQFFVVVPPGRTRKNSHEPAYWFGGTEYGPFLVEMHERPYQVLRREGEKGFYEELKPEIIAGLEEVFGVFAERQGDIFAFPFADSIAELNSIYNLFDLEARVRFSFVSEFPVFNTRHKLTGFYALWRRTATVGGHDEEFAFAQGVIEAPDHPPLKLSKIHLLAQADGLARPTDAD